MISRVIDKTFENDAWYLHTRFDTQDLPDRWLHGLNSEETWRPGFFHEKFLVGRVVGRIPFLGYAILYVSMFILNPVAMFLIIIVVFLIVSLKYPFLFRKKAKA